MTGQITPYYLKNLNTNIYHHLNYVSGAAALAGECINGHHDDGKYYLTNSRQEVAYYRSKTNHILSKALPLMDIYMEESREKLYSFLSNESEKEGERCNLHATLPLYTISDELFLQILERNHISDNQQHVLLEYLHTIRNYFMAIPHKDCASDAPSDFSSDETKSGVNTLCIHEHFCEI